MGGPVQSQRYTISEYLHFERDALEKHEYRDGRIIAMAGGSFNHSLISQILSANYGMLSKPSRVRH
jgi:Uma2 family endonuclease